MNNKIQTTAPNKPAKIRPEDLGTKTLNISNPEHLAKFANVLQAYITGNKLSTKIGDKEYAHVDGWKFAAMNFGLTPICKKPVRIDEGKTVYNLFEGYVDYPPYKDAKPVNKERIFYSGTDLKVVEEMKIKRTPTRILMTELYSYECECELFAVKTGMKVGYGHAICSNNESKKAVFDQYAIASMAQTRSIGKAVKNMIGFIMNAAGFENTPAEEMEELKYSQNTNPDPTPDPTKARVVPEGGIDDITSLVITEKETLEELSDFWDENIELQGNLSFQTAMRKRKEEIKAKLKSSK